MEHIKKSEKEKQLLKEIYELKENIYFLKQKISNLENCLNS